MRSATKKVGLVLGIVVTISAVAGPVRADLTLVTDRASLNANDSINWGQFGGSGTTVPSGSTVTTALGNTATVTDASGNPIILVQSTSWYGNFSPGDNLLYTGAAFGSGNGPLTLLTFATAVGGIGAQIQADYYGSFTAQITAYDASNNVLGVFTENGTANGNADGSAIFIGVISSTANISSIQFALTNDVGGGNGDFAINQVSIGGPSVSTVPEPSTFAVAGLGGLGLLAYARRRTVKAKR
jgi:PEP-CTERM motif